ncbi:variant erythrocyte surface antigen-1 alpha subunit [Babesia bovis T2Bo]|uniref:variant erythrocyte surface antigen-1 alpha subunit n=1 Tax=Babesia bovis T2Bo TaxID=484906 RepID=UPI001C36BE28|nr:variant erythrocyte surface antigen-1 alpha subunit [Babesia bovis T2Bo]KAG6440211.1 variant erythrocyte surface antigen-1 alpha subunit [Babesia bovis T2Bo]
MSSFKPYSSLTDAPTNLKEAIDWVLRVTGKDGKPLDEKNGECICGLAAAVTDLLQSVQLEYHGYEGEAPNNGPPKDQVTQYLNGLFSLVQGLGGTAVVRTYIDQLAQVLSALVGWSKIDKCWDKGKCQKGGNGYQHGIKTECGYLKDVTPNTPCKECGCMKWNDPNPSSNEGHHLGRRCTKCKGSGDSTGCSCSSAGGKQCTADKECKCDRKCECTNGTYRSAYGENVSYQSYIGEIHQLCRPPNWEYLKRGPPGFNADGKQIKDGLTPSQRRHQCARILLGSVCLIWSGLTYMYWTGKWAKSSPRWNNHILDGTGLDDGTLSQWLQALGFPREMLNDHGPGNRWDQVINNDFVQKFYLGFADTSGSSGNNGHGNDINGTTFRNPSSMNYAGYIHTLEKGAFCSNATVFKKANGATITEENIHKCGALYKLYILSCAYFTGLQKKRSTQSNTPTTPRTIREILYWLSALPYSQAYQEILKHSKEVLKKVAPDKGGTKTLSFIQTGRNAPITVHEFNLFAHFQAVTQYCPLVLICIQGGIHSTNSSTPAIHSLYANTECHFTYPTVSIQAYNQVVHYIRALFYQLYFLRKQCAVKVALGGKWRECRYGDGVVSKGVISWMCLGCNPMEHDRKCRVDELGKELVGVINKLTALEWRKAEETKKREEKLERAEKLITLFEAIGNVVVQLGNAQEALEGKKKEAIEAVKTKLTAARTGLHSAKEKLNENGLNEELKDAKAALGVLTNGGGGNGGILEKLIGGDGLDKASNGEENQRDFSSGKDRISEAINKVHEVMKLIKEWAEQDKDEVICHLKDPYNEFLKAIEDLISICTSPKCPPCESHSKKCGQPSTPSICRTCLQPTTTGVPSPLQAFLEDRLPGFSCDEVVNDDKDNPDYPPAASHLEHCNGSGQCCPLPMGFRGQFLKGGISDCTGKRLYGILYFFSNGDMMQSCVYTLVRVTAALSATTPQVLGDVFGFFRGGVGNPEQQEGQQKGTNANKCDHSKKLSDKKTDDYFCGWCASGLRDEVQKIEWIPFDSTPGGQYLSTVGKALRDIKGDKGSSGKQTGTTSLSALTDSNHYVSPLTGELYTAVSATFGNTYLSWVLYLSDSLYWGLQSLASEFKQIECRGCKGQCDPNKCKKGHHGASSDGQCGCQSIVSCTGVLPVLYRHGFSYGNPFNLEGFQQSGKDKGDYSIQKAQSTKQCHQFLDSINAVIKTESTTPLTNLLSQVGKLQYDIRLPWIFVLTLAWLMAVLYLAFGAIWPLDWTHMRSHWLRGGEHQWQCMWYKVMTGRKGMALVEYFGKT